MGELLRDVRYRANLTQRERAARSGVAQSAIAAYERGTRSPSLDVLARLLEAVGLRAVLETRPRWEHVDRALIVRRHESLEERARSLPWLPVILERVASGVEWTVAGAAAVCLQGVPLPVPVVDLWVPDDDEQLELWSDALVRLTTSFDAEKGLLTYRQPTPDLLRAGPTCWTGAVGSLRITVRAAGTYPEPLRLEVDCQTLPVVPLAGVELLDAESAEVLARARALYAAQDERASAAENAS